MDFVFTIINGDLEQSVEDKKDIVFPILIQDIKQRISQQEKCFIFQADTGIGKSTLFIKMLYDSFPQYQIQCTQPTRLNTISIAEFMQKKYKLVFGKNLGIISGMKKIYLKYPGIIYSTVGSALSQFLAIKNKDKPFTRKLIIVIDEAHLNSIELTMFIALMQQMYQKKNSPIFIIQSASINVRELQTYFKVNFAYKIMGKTAKITKLYASQIIPEQQYRKMQISQVACELVKLIYQGQNKILENAIQQQNIIQDQGILIFVTGKQMMTQVIDLLKEMFNSEYPIYKLSSSDVNEGQLLKINQPGKKIIVATNVAETGVTLENLSFVIDCLKFKASYYNPNLKINYLRDLPISRQMQLQRMGRVGRIGNGMYIAIGSESIETMLLQQRENSILLYDLRLMSIIHGTEILLNLPFQVPILEEQILDLYQTKMFLNYNQNIKQAIFQKIMFSLFDLEYIFDRYFIYLCYQFGFKLADAILFFAYIENLKVARNFQKMPIFAGRNDLETLFKFFSSEQIINISEPCSLKFMFLANFFTEQNINIFKGKEVRYDMNNFSKLFIQAYQQNLFYLHSETDESCIYQNKSGVQVYLKIGNIKKLPQKIVFRELTDQGKFQCDFIIDATDQQFIIEDLLARQQRNQ